jgi:hypothetical protein
MPFGFLDDAKVNQYSEYANYLKQKELNKVHLFLIKKIIN